MPLRRRLALLTLVPSLLGGAAVLGAGPADAAGRYTCFGRKATIVSSRRSITGTRRTDVIVVLRARGASVDGREGDDLICGRGGPDFLSGGLGHDKISGGAGRDALDGGPGDDVVVGGLGDDTISTGAGTDLAHGGPGADRMTAGPGVQRLEGEDGDDVLTSYQGGPVIRVRAAFAQGAALAGCETTLVGGPGADQGSAGVCAVTFAGDAADTFTIKPGDAPSTVTGGAAVVGAVPKAVAGLVADAAGPLAGVPVTFLGQESFVKATVATDAAGRYSSAGLPEQAYEVVINDPHATTGAYRPRLEVVRRKGVAPAAGDQPAALLAPAAMITGVVRSTAGTPLAGATVAAFDGPRGLLTNDATTDAAGRYVIGSITAGGTYELVADADRHARSAAAPRVEVASAADAVSAPDLVLRPWSPAGGPYVVAGSVRGAAGLLATPVPVALVDEAGATVATATTSPVDGSFFVPGTHAAGTYALRINTPELAGRAATLPYALRWLELPVDGGTGVRGPDADVSVEVGADVGSLRVTVTDDAAAPAPLAGVVVTATDGEGVAYVATTGADGVATIAGVTPGQLATITATGAGRAPTTVTDVVVAAGPATTASIAMPMPMPMPEPDADPEAGADPTP